MMIHCPWATMAGTADDFENTAGTLREIERRYCSTYAVRSGMPEAEVLTLMKAETWFTAEQAIQAGFADEIDDAIARAKAVRGRVAVCEYSHGGASDGRSRSQAQTDGGTAREAQAPVRVDRRAGQVQP